MGFGVARVDRLPGGAALAATIALAAPVAFAGDLDAAVAAASEAEPVCCFGREVPSLRFDAAGADVRVGAWIALDALHRGSTDEDSTDFAATHLRPTVDIVSGPFRGRVEGDAIGTDTPRNLYEAWAAWEVVPEFRLSAGQFRVALGSEAATHESELPFVGYGFTSYLSTRNDVGVRADGGIGRGIGQVAWYQAAWTAGHAFGLEGQRLDGTQVSVRAALRPLRAADVSGAHEILRNLHVGAGWADRSDGDEPVRIVTPLQATVFDTPDLDGDGGSWFQVEVGTSWGPFSFGFEDVVGSVDGVPVAGGGDEDFDELTGFTWFAAWNLSGEPRAWSDGAWTSEIGKAPDGTRPGFLPAGRWELAARYSNADIDRGLFDAGITRYGVSTQEVRTFSLALSWEPCTALRFLVEWVRTNADDDLGTFDGEDGDSSIVFRAELRF
jgi:hypothetical protein